MLLLLSPSLGLCGCVVVVSMTDIISSKIYLESWAVRELGSHCSGDLCCFCCNCNFNDCSTKNRIKTLNLNFISSCRLTSGQDTVLLLSWEWLGRQLRINLYLFLSGKCYLLKFTAFTCGLQYVEHYIQNMGKLIYFEKLDKNLYLIFAFQVIWAWVPYRYKLSQVQFYSLHLMYIINLFNIWLVWSSCIKFNILAHYLAWGSSPYHFAFTF